MNVRQGDIVQVTNHQHHWYPALLIVDEVKSWGVQAMLLTPEDNTGTKPIRQAYIRLPNEDFQVVGVAVITFT